MAHFFLAAHVEGNNPLRIQKVVSLDLEEEKAHEGYQVNFKNFTTDHYI